MIRRFMLAALVAVTAAGAAYAQSGAAVSGAAAIQARKDVLKTFGPVSRDLGQMLRGEAAFDLAKAQAGLRVLADGAPRLPALFPADSQTGDTKALPAIWQEKDKFNAIFVKLEADAKAALAAVTNEATFRAEAPKVFANCGACHNPYRAR